MVQRRRSNRKGRAQPSQTDSTVEAVAFVAKQYFEGTTPISEQSSKNESVQVRRFVTEPARVSLAMGLTINLGNYQAARIDVSLTLPCYREEVDQAYTDCKEWVEERVRREVDDVRANKPSLF